jgi:hypothetical protein
LNRAEAIGAAPSAASILRPICSSKNEGEEQMRTTHIRQAMAAMTLALGLALVAPTGAAAVGEGETCGTIVGITCDKGLWCDLEAGKCGGADIAGKCVKVPRGCPRNIAWVCGCNKRNYANDCVRQNAKVQKDHDGRCTKYKK